MNNIGGIRRLCAAVVSGAVLTALNAAALAATGDGYTISDLRLNTANELVDVCNIDEGHEHYDAVLAFCYGFSEGAIRYHDVIAQNPSYVKVVCDPPGATRRQAVEAFIQFIDGNPQYGEEAPIDAIFRALAERWPCPE